MYHYLTITAYLVVSFPDADEMEWDELMDNDTADFFYHCEDTDKYSWDKPEIPVLKSISKMTVTPLALGEEVFYQFPDRLKPDKCVITKCREDDETGADMYDLQCINMESYKAKWVPRFRCQRMPRTNEDMKLEVMRMICTFMVLACSVV